MLSELNQTRAEIDERRTELLQELAGAGGAQGPLSAAQQRAMLESERQLYEDYRKRAVQSLATVREARQKILEFDATTDQLESEIQRIDRELDPILINWDSTKESLCSITEHPFVPTTPAKDRRIPLAAIGAMAGAGLVVLAFAGLGFLDRRLRFVDQIAESSLAAPLLGVLPTLNSKREDQAHLAAESVHHLRNMLEVQLDAAKPTVARVLRGSMPCRGCGHELKGISIKESCPTCGQPVSDTILATVDDANRTPRHVGRSVVITSAGAGDGKTSVTAALGMSFAATGRRTVVVDADLVGRGLSDSLGARHRPRPLGAPGRGAAQRRVAPNRNHQPLGAPGRAGRRPAPRADGP